VCCSMCNVSQCHSLSNHFGYTEDIFVVQKRVQDACMYSFNVCAICVHALKTVWHSNTLLCTERHLNTLQHAATHCNTGGRKEICSYCIYYNVYAACVHVFKTRSQCNTLQHTAILCNTLQRTATHCNALQHTATHCNTLQYTVTNCNTHKHTTRGDQKHCVCHHLYAVPTEYHCNTLQRTATLCNALQHTATGDRE